MAEDDGLMVAVVHLVVTTGATTGGVMFDEVSPVAGGVSSGAIHARLPDPV